MSQFIVPLSTLPTLPSITEAKGQQDTGGNTGNIPFASLLQDAVNELAQASEVSSEGMYDLALGANDDLHTGAINALKTSTAVSYTAGITSAAVRAYNELMRMQI